MLYCCGPCCLRFGSFQWVLLSGGLLERVLLSVLILIVLLLLLLVSSNHVYKGIDDYYKWYFTLILSVCVQLGF